MKTAARLAHLEVTLIREFLRGAPANALNLGLGQTNEPVPKAVTERISEELFDGSGAPYGPNAGDVELRRAIGAFENADANNVIVTAGVQEALFLSIMGCVDPGDTVAVPAPAFPVYASIARIAGAEVIEYELRAEDRFRPTPAVIQGVLEKKPDLIVLCSPGNPTGAVASTEDWAAIGRLLERSDRMVLSDEIYATLQGSDDRHASIRDYCPSALTTSGLSKSHGLAGWRMGWLVAPPEIVSKLTALHQHVMTSASTLIQRAALGAFSRAGWDSVRALADELSDKRELAIDLLKAGGWDVAAGDGAFYLWLRHKEFADGLQLAEGLRDEAGVLTIPGIAFGEAGAGYIRLSYSVEESVLIEAIAHMNHYVSGETDA